MNCPKCGNPLAQDTKFCAKCGTPVPVAQPAVTAPVAPSQPVATPKAKKQKSNDKKKKNLGLKITAAVLVVAVLICGIYSAVFGIKNSNETKGDGVTYISDFPVLKNETEFMVYDEETFPAERYEIKVERFLLGGVLKNVSSRSEEFTRTSSDHIYDLSLENGEYRITLTDITATRTQESSADKQENTTASTTVIIDVTVDNDNPEALGKVTLDSKPGDKPQENNTATSTDFIEATDEDFENLTDLADNIFGTGYFEGYDTFDCEKSSMDFVDNAIFTTYWTFYEYIFDKEIDRNPQESTDPLNKFGSAGFTVLPKDDIKWLCENIFNLEFDENHNSDLGYVYGDYYYVLSFNAGGGPGYVHELKSHSVAEDKYEVIIDVFEEELGTENPNLRQVRSIKITAEIKESDGKRYWSIYKIENYTPSSEPSQDTPAAKDMYAENAQLYNEFIKNGGVGDISDPYLEFKSCLIDMNNDGTYELVLEITNTEYPGAFGYGSMSYVYGIQNQSVVLLKEVEYGGGTGGGDKIYVEYDNVAQKHSVYIDSLARDGAWASTYAVILLEYDGNQIIEKEKYERSHYSLESETYKPYVEKVKQETNLYVLETYSLIYCTHNGQYISEDEFENNTTNRFTEPTDSKYETKTSTADNPLGL